MPVNVRTTFQRPVLSFILFLLILTGAAVCTAQSPSKKDVSVSVDWADKAVRIEIRKAVPSTGRNLPAAPFVVEEAVRSSLDAYFLSALGSFPVSSSATLGKLAAADPGIAEAIANLARSAVKAGSALSGNLSSFSAVYVVPFYPDLARPAVRHTRPYPPPRLIRYVPTTGYTGIVLYAKGPLPVHGEPGTSPLEPCLFPRLYDGMMNLLLTPEMVDPSVLLSTGMASYTSSDSPEVIKSVAGENPLYIVVDRLFGTRRSDIVIPNEDAARILSSEANRKLLTSGKILIVCDLD